MKLSIVTTLYQSAPYIKEFHTRTSTAAQTVVGDEYEIIIVNDGSPDNSLDVAIQLIKDDSHVKVIDLSRNFGHHKAMMTGLNYAKGDLIFLIDVDLEEEPEYLFEFIKHMQNESCDVVYGVQKQRKGKWFERWSGQVFYWLFKLITGLNLPANIITARLMTRRYVDALIRHQEREVFMAGILEVTGYKQLPIEVIKHSRSETSYTFRKKLDLFVTAITSFSNKPLWLIFYTGIFITLISTVFIMNIIIRKLVFNIEAAGWASIVVSIWFMGGLIICFMGIIGLYISVIFIETKKRPYVIVRQIYQKQITTEKENYNV